MKRIYIWLVRLLVAVPLSAVSSHGFASSSLLDRVPLPEGSRVYRVGSDIVQNGRPVSIATFVSDASVAETLDWYRTRWPEREQDPGHVTAEIGGWKVISRLEGDFNIVLQLKPSEAGGATGLLSVLSLDGMAVNLDAAVTPPGAILLSDTRAGDRGGTARTRFLRIPGSPADAAAFYRDQLARAGWTVQRDDRSGTTAVLLFTSRAGRIELVANPHSEGGTFIVMNRVTGEH